MNECPEEALLLDFAEGRLSATPALDQLKKHVDGCDSCRDVMKHLAAQSPLESEQTQQHDPLIGATVGEYRVEDRIGEGGMGMVYRGIQPVIGKPVAIKVIKPELAGTESTTRRFIDEARAANTIGHRNIIDIFSFGTLPGGEQYFVMEYLVGEPLSHYLKRTGALAPREAVDLLVELVSALSAAHAAGVVHRDLKPSNLFLVLEPDGKRLLKVLDFGIAKLLTNDRPHTQPGSILGTPEYMSPEQVRGEPPGAEVDLYALGVIAFELLTGGRPFRGHAAEVMAQHIDVAPPAVSTVTPAVHPTLDALVARLLSKEPKSRGTAERVLETLTALQKLPADDTTEPLARPLLTPHDIAAATTPDPPRSRRGPLIAVSAALGAVLAVTLVVLARQSAPTQELAPPPPPPRAEVVQPQPQPPPVAAPVPDSEAPKRGASPKVVDVKTRRGELLAQIDSLRRATKADPSAQLLLDDADKRARNAQALDDLKKVERMLDAVRAGYVKKR
ncbi:MAG: serine/threonine protein kinase [Myxococcaceae bacterium]|nr:serine/threonine protein kinase [Myxococcaceae bacterium]